METINAKYQATSKTKSSVVSTAPELPLELHQMIVWIMHCQSDAAQLLLEYRKWRQQRTEREDAQKTNCSQDVGGQPCTR